jgi:mannose-6-phosphate isomerase-like protein (cupin superfamily)
MIQKINLAEKFAAFGDHWSPKVIGNVNNAAVKLVKLQGEFVWHHHDFEDEMFLVIKGEFVMKLREGDVLLKAGECIIIPAGVEHMPFAKQEVEVLLFEPDTTLNTGNVTNEKTVEVLERL